MGGGSLFSGLVQGLGSSLGTAFNRKHEEDQQKQQYMLHLLSSSLVNDDTLPQGARREGLKQIGSQYGVKMPDELLNMIAPDFPDEGGGQDNAMPQMPRSPIQAPAQQASAPQTQPQVGGQAPAKGDQQPMGQGVIGEMPRNPLMDAPTILPSTGSSSAPVTASYTQGPGTTSDHVELAAHIQQLEHQLDNMPQRKAQGGNISRAEMQQQRARRMQMEGQDRDAILGQIQALHQMQNQRDQAAFQMGMEPAELHQKIQGMETELGRPLTDLEKSKMFGIGPDPQEIERANEAKDYGIINNKQIPDTAPEKQAASARVRGNELGNAQKLASIQNAISEIAARAAADKDPANKPGYVTKVKALSAAAAGGLFGTQDQQSYFQERQKFWIGELQSGAQAAPQAPTGDPAKDQMNAFIANLAAMSKANPQSLSVNAAKLAQQDVKSYQTKLAEQIFNNTIAEPDKKTVTLRWIQRRAKQAQDMGGDPNKIWTYWKLHSTILDDDLEPWQNPK